MFFISKSREGWKVTDEDMNVLGEFPDKRAAEQEMVALSAEQNLEAGGEKGLPENYRPALSEDVPPGGACGTCQFFDESRISEDGTQAWCTRWEDFADGGFYCDAWEPKEGMGDAPMEDPMMDPMMMDPMMGAPGAVQGY
jgi:hypothetical protein